ncbi:MAG: 50S ribosomal protein L37ae [Methanomassiliicoccales archaeon]|nr:50S ribosomal protein L37ae [Methanomassiliicoccales archaeon]
MSKGTEKVGSAGRFGARYGVRARKLIRDIERTRKMPYECPNCHHKSVKRLSSGVWLCRHCDTKFAAGSYSPTIKRIVTEERTEKASEEGSENV